MNYKAGKKQEVYCLEEGIGQSCISVKWILSRKIKNGTKARLYEATKKFHTKELHIHHTAHK